MDKPTDFDSAVALCYARSLDSVANMYISLRACAEQGVDMVYGCDPHPDRGEVEAAVLAKLRAHPGAAPRTLARTLFDLGFDKY